MNSLHTPFQGNMVGGTVCVWLKQIFRWNDKSAVGECIFFHHQHRPDTWVQRLFVWITEFVRKWWTTVSDLRFDRWVEAACTQRRWTTQTHKHGSQPPHPACGQNPDLDSGHIQKLKKHTPRTSTSTNTRTHTNVITHAESNTHTIKHTRSPHYYTWPSLHKTLPFRWLTSWLWLKYQRFEKSKKRADINMKRSSSERFHLVRNHHDKSQINATFCTMKRHRHVYQKPITQANTHFNSVCLISDKGTLSLYLEGHSSVIGVQRNTHIHTHSQV